jgi:leucyl-tRNA synthetase
MSKSLGNVVSPDDMVAKFGADSARMYTLFATSPDRELDWQDEGVEGIQRFLGRVYRFVSRNAQPDHREWSEPVAENLPPAARAIQRKLHQTIKRVTDDFQGRWHFNTCIAATMELVNELHAVEGAQDSSQGSGLAEKLTIPLLAEAQRTLVLLIAPFAPYLAQELWSEYLKEERSLLRAAWPKYDPALAKEDEIEIPVQINGKLRARIVVSADATEDTVREHALAEEKIKTLMAGKQVVKVIIVPLKLVNVVIR